MTDEGGGTGDSHEAPTVCPGLGQALDRDAGVPWLPAMGITDTTHDSALEQSITSAERLFSTQRRFASVLAPTHHALPCRQAVPTVLAGSTSNQSTKRSSLSPRA